VVGGERSIKLGYIWFSAKFMYVKGKYFIKKGKALFSGGGIILTKTGKTLNIFFKLFILRQLVLRSIAKRETAQIIF